MIPPKQESQNDDSKDKNNKDSDSKQSQRHASNEYDVNMYRQSINSQMGYQQEDSLHSNQPENSDNKQQSMNSSRSQQSSHEQLSTQESSHQSKGKRRTILKETTQSISKISTLLKSLKRLDVKENEKYFKNVDLRKHYKLKDNKIKTQKRIVFKSD